MWRLDFFKSKRHYLTKYLHTLSTDFVAVNVLFNVKWCKTGDNSVDCVHKGHFDVTFIVLLIGKMVKGVMIGGIQAEKQFKICLGGYFDKYW